MARNIYLTLIKELREAGVKITETIEVPEVAFTGDTTSDWITNPACADALRAKLLICECTFVVKRCMLK